MIAQPTVWRGVRRTLPGLLISAVALVLAFRQVELAEVAAAFADAHYGLVAVAAVLQLLVLAAIALRWRLLFRDPPDRRTLFGALLIAQVANTVLPLRAGLVARVWVIARQSCQPKITVLSTVVAEKTVESLLFLLLFAAVLPGLAPHWFSRSSLGWATTAAVLLFPVLLLASVRQHAVRRLLQAGARRWPSRARLAARLQAGLDGLERLRAPRALLGIWAWSVGIAAMGVSVNYAALRALGLDVPVEAALVLLVALQIGGRLLPATPLAGIGVYQYICVESLALFGVSREAALTYGFLLQFVVLVPPLLLGTAAIYRANYSLAALRREELNDSG